MMSGVSLPVACRGWSVAVVWNDKIDFGLEVLMQVAM